jgi:hypothetical protein
MTIQEIAKVLLDGDPEGEWIEMQHWNNKLSEGHINALWRYATQQSLERKTEKYQGVGEYRGIARYELEKLVDTDSRITYEQYYKTGVMWTRPHES